MIASRQSVLIQWLCYYFGIIDWHHM